MKFVQVELFEFLREIFWITVATFRHLNPLFLLGFVGRDWTEMGVMSELYLQY